MDGIMRDNGGSSLPLSQTCLYTGLNNAKMAGVGLPHSSCMLAVWLRLSLDYPFQLLGLSLAGKSFNVNN